MNPTHKDENVDNPGREPLGDIDPNSDRKGEVPSKPSEPDRADDREAERSTGVNDDDVGQERRDREPVDPQKNPRTGPIG